MTKSDPRNVCDACRQSLDRRLRSHVELGPIVHDHIWRQIADPPRGSVLHVHGAYARYSGLAAADVELKRAVLGEIVRARFEPDKVLATYGKDDLD
jgi:hypothetical protein